MTLVRRLVAALAGLPAIALVQAGYFDRAWWGWVGGVVLGLVAVVVWPHRSRLDRVKGW